MDVVDADYAEDDKSIIKYELADIDKQSLSVQVYFGNPDAISSDINQPDEISIRIIRPDLFVDFEFGKALSSENEESTIKVAPQFSI